MEYKRVAFEIGQEIINDSMNIKIVKRTKKMITFLEPLYEKTTTRKLYIGSYNEEFFLPFGDFSLAPRAHACEYVL